MADLDKSRCSDTSTKDTGQHAVAQFTPGPWVYGRMGDAERYWIGPSWDRPVVAYADRDMPETNARLIAAAPELYAALEKLVVVMGRRNQQLGITNSSVLKEACAALAKARGSLTTDRGPTAPAQASSTDS